MTEETKFTDDELKSISELQNRYQQSIFKLGEIQIRKLSITEDMESARKMEEDIKDEYLTVQTDEASLLKSLTEKYGEGSLNAKTGTFTPAVKSE